MTRELLRNRSLRQRLVFLLLLASAPGMLVAVFLAANALSDQARQIESEARRLAAIQAAQHTNVLENARIMLDTLVESGDEYRVERRECRSYLKGWLERYLSFTSLTLLDAEGNMVCSNLDTDMPFDPAQEGFFKRVKAEKDFVVGDYSVGRSGKPLIIAARPVLGPDGAFAGAVAVGIDLRWLEFLARRVDLPPGSTITAMDAEGNVLNHYRAHQTDEAEAPPAGGLPAEHLRREMAALGNGVQHGLTEAFAEQVYGFEKTDTGGLIIAVGMPRYLAFERYGAALRDTLAAPFAVLILALVAAAYASEALVTRWVRRLTRSATRMAGGDRRVRSGVPHSQYEIGRLAAAFDHLAEEIERNEAELGAMLEQRQALLRELNHRAKNNMQLIIGLLELQAREVEERRTREIIADIVGRIRALAEIHRLLYREGHEIAATSDYTVLLGRSLEEFYSTASCKVELSMAPLPMSVDGSIVLGLILNELLANACKHAFPDGRRGHVKVSLTAQDGNAHLSVADNGVRLPAGFDLDGELHSSGLSMVRGLSRQLGGRLFVEQEGDLKVFHLEFPLEEP